MYIKIGQFLRLFTGEDSSDGNCRIVIAVTCEGRRPGLSERRDAAPGRPFSLVACALLWFFRPLRVLLRPPWEEKNQINEAAEASSSSLRVVRAGSAGEAERGRFCRFVPFASCRVPGDVVSDTRTGLR